MAKVRIPASEIKPGKSSNGIVYLKAYKNDELLFDEVNCKALFCLPVADARLTDEGLTAEVCNKDFDGKAASVLKITDVSYEYEKKSHLG